MKLLFQILLYYCPQEYLRLFELVTYIIYVCIARSVPEVPDPMYEFMFGYNYSWMLLVFAMGVSYAVIYPLITPCLLVYLVMKHAADRSLLTRT